MKLLRTASAKTLALVLTLMFVSATVASAGVVLRTPPFPGFNVFSGQANCVARYGGEGTAKVTLKLFDDEGTLLATVTETLSPDDVGRTQPVSLDTESPTWCECAVPSGVTTTCSFVYNNGPINAFVPAQ